tara:strand:+ start:92 stop:490 length:399 start_codon:yes stop_codon:yes gene_type:complete
MYDKSYSPVEERVGGWVERKVLSPVYSTGKRFFQGFLAGAVMPWMLATSVRRFNDWDCKSPVYSHGSKVSSGVGCSLGIFSSIPQSVLVWDEASRGNYWPLAAFVATNVTSGAFELGRSRSRRSDSSDEVSL